MLLIALVVKLTSPGPIFYRGRRAGLCGREFWQLKFRSMRTGAAGSSFTARDDDRITPIGRLIRTTKLDEFPQLFNVLRGEMSLVGPRPEAFDVVEELYTREQLRVLTVRPGLTCLLQVRIFPDFTYDVPTGADPTSYYRHTILPARLAEDLEYVDRQSLALDLKLLAQTAWCLLFKSWPLLAGRARQPQPIERRA
jgi:lipopolysaccharide/colanic/teichoic acid biosynthesis glycosyltransferase